MFISSTRLFPLALVAISIVGISLSFADSDSEVTTEYIYELRQERKFEELEALAMKTYEDAYGDYHNGDYREAGVKFKELVFLYPGFSKAVEASYYMGESFYKAGDFTDARDAFTRLIKSNPDSIYYPVSLYRMEQLGFKQERYTEAIFYHQEILNRYQAGTLTIPAEAQKDLNVEEFIDSANYIGGLCRYSIGEFQGAYDVLSQVRSSSEYFGFSQYTMALCYVQQDDIEGAIQQLRAIDTMSFGGGIEIALKNLTYVTLGRLFYEVGRYDEAVEEYQRVDSSDAENYDNALLGLGWVYIKQEKYSKACEYFEKIVSRRASSELIAEAKLSLAHCHLGTGEYDKAMEEYRDIKQNYNLELELAGDPRVSEVYQGIFDEMDKVEEIYLGFLELDDIAKERDMDDIHQQIQVELQEVRRLQDQLAGLEMWFSGRSTTGRNLMLGAEFGMATIAFQKEQLMEKEIEQLSLETYSKITQLKLEKLTYSEKVEQEVSVEEQSRLGYGNALQGESGVVSFPTPEEFGLTKDVSGEVIYSPGEYFPTEKRETVTGPVEEETIPPVTPPEEKESETGTTTDETGTTTDETGTSSDETGTTSDETTSTTE